ncbi:uncharacterized protein [Chiloscyllium punctatum]|uniref:uncharacterized protein n=1 Tax=Chiloscyllium punctatum TaxID=137246 RepID=UPI003B63442D
MSWTRGSLMAVLSSCWLQALLQTAAAAAMPRVVKGRVNSSIFLEVSFPNITDQVDTVEWKYASPKTRRCIVQLISEEEKWNIHWFSGYSQRARIYPNHSLSIQNVALNDSGTYSCTVTDWNGDEFTEDVIVTVIGEMQIYNGWNTTGVFNLTFMKANETNDYKVFENFGLIAALSGTGALIIIAILTWAVVGHCRRKSRRQGKTTKDKQSHKDRNNESDDIYENMGRVPQ